VLCHYCSSHSMHAYSAGRGHSPVSFSSSAGSSHLSSCSRISTWARYLSYCLVSWYQMTCRLLRHSPHPLIYRGQKIRIMVYNSSYFSSISYLLI
jgi:hypothetical protein